MGVHRIHVSPPEDQNVRLRLFDLLDVPASERATRLELRTAGEILEVVDSTTDQSLGRLPLTHPVVRRGGELHRIIDFEVIGNGWRPAAAYLEVTVVEITDLDSADVIRPGRR